MSKLRSGRCTPWCFLRGCSGDKQQFRFGVIVEPKGDTIYPAKCLILQHTRFCGSPAHKQKISGRLHCTLAGQRTGATRRFGSE